MQDKYGTGYDVAYCYPGSEVLRNLLNITDQDRLNRAEVEFTRHRLQAYQYPALASFSLQTWKNIHFHLFQDVYSWAGELRRVKISKGSTVFAMPEQLEQYGANLFKQIEKENFLCGFERPAFVEKLAYHFGELNLLHPFREGNGRSQRLLFELIAMNADYALDWQGVDPEQWIQANIAAVAGDTKPLTRIFDGVAIKLATGLP